MVTSRNRPVKSFPSSFLLVLALVLPVACGSFKFDVGTSEPIKLDPIKVDLNMRVDVYQYTGNAEEEKVAATSRKDAATRLRDRMKEVQELKNNRFVGENHLGLLSIRDSPAGDYGDYVRRTVDEENADRVYVMTDKANRDGTVLADVQTDQWNRRVQSSFPGEWIETPGGAADTFRWVQKSGG